MSYIYIYNICLKFFLYYGYMVPLPRPGGRGTRPASSQKNTTSSTPPVLGGESWLEGTRGRRVGDKGWGRERPVRTENLPFTTRFQYGRFWDSRVFLQNSAVTNSTK